MNDSPNPHPKKHKILLNIIKTIFTLGLLALLIYQLRNVSIKRLVLMLDWKIFSLAFLTMVGHNLLGAWRWQTLLNKYRSKVPFINLLKYYYIGNFLGFFLPTSVGGDVARIYFLQRDTRSLEIGSSTVIVERVLGVVSIVLLFFYSVIFGLYNIVDISLLWPVLIFLVLLICGLWVLFYFPQKWLDKVLFFSPRINQKIQNIFLELKSFRHEPWLIIQALCLSILFQLAMIVAYDLLSISVDLKIAFHDFLLLMPVIWILSLLPFSLNGLGIREGAFVFLFSSLGYPSEKLTFVSMLGVVLLIFQGIIGGIIFIFAKHGKQVLSEIESEVI